MKGHTSNVTCVFYTPDDRIIISGSYDKTIKLWNASTYELIANIEGNIS